MFCKKLGKAVNVAERCAQVVRDRIGKRLQLVVGGRQLRGTFGYSLFEVFIEFPDFQFSRFLLRNITESNHPTTHHAVFVSQRGPIGFDPDPAV